jgi:hypothetical protein
MEPLLPVERLGSTNDSSGGRGQRWKDRDSLWSHDGPLNRLPGSPTLERAAAHRLCSASSSGVLESYAKIISQGFLVTILSQA